MTRSTKLKLIECPRDSMQGWKPFIPTAKKIEYINALLQVGFDTLDFGSFVSAKAIPQLADTAEVINALQKHSSNTKLLAIVANLRGAEDASLHENIDFLGFPFSVSETFQRRNTNSSIIESLERVEDIQDLCIKNGKELVIYLSMGFGNPYGDPYSKEIVFEWAEKIAALNISIISLADTVGVASAAQVEEMTSYLVKALPQVEIGVHLHAAPNHWKDKLSAALSADCIRFDSALKGIGGCPLANDDLVGNMDTERMIGFFQEQGLEVGLDEEAMERSLYLAAGIFN